MEKAFFNHIRSEITPLLRMAKDDVLVAMAWFTSKELFQELLDCLSRGVRVELVLLDDASNFMYYAPDFNQFIKAGGIMRIAKVENGFMHHKFCVIDSEIVITGSYNWTYSAETKNIENIVMTNNNVVVTQYRNEFKKLASYTPKVSTSPRLSWEELAIRPNTNYVELNNEIEYISKAQKLPIRKVVYTHTKVTVEEVPSNPVSKYNLGIKMSSRGDDNSFETIIPKGAKLPYLSEYHNFYSYLDRRKNLVITILYNDKAGRRYIANRNISDITMGRNDWELTIQVQFSLLQNGDLLAEVRCVETSKTIQVKMSNIDLVEYVS